MWPKRKGWNGQRGRGRLLEMLPFKLIKGQLEHEMFGAHGEPFPTSGLQPAQEALLLCLPHSGAYLGGCQGTVGQDEQFRPLGKLLGT